MLTYLLAADPTTPSDVLTYLAGRPLTAAAARALATHPHFPADATLRIPEDDGPDSLHTALSDPRLPQARRQVFIDATDPFVVSQNIRSHDDLTPTELGALFVVFNESEESGTWNTFLTALAHNPHTPAPLAPTVIAALRKAGKYLLADVVALRHHVSPVTPAARDAVTHTDPLAAYARNLTAALARGDENWASVVADFPHPIITTAALTAATPHAQVPLPPATFTAMCRELALNPRAALKARLQAVALSPKALPFVEDIAPDSLLRSFAPDAFRPCGWHNPNATDATLRSIYTRARSLGGPHIFAGIALHPAASPALRQDIVADPTRARPGLTALVTQLNRGTPDAALDVAYPDLLATQADTPNADHWVHAAWKHHHTHTPMTLAYAQALLTLEAGGFPGTLRDLISTARTIAT